MVVQGVFVAGSTDESEPSVATRIERPRCDRLLDDGRIAVRRRPAPPGPSTRCGSCSRKYSIDRRGQQARLFAVLERRYQRMAIVERIEAILVRTRRPAPSRAGSTRAPCSPSQLAVVAIGQHLVAEKKDQPAPLLQIRLEHAGFAGGELADVAEKHAVVTAPDRARAAQLSGTTSGLTSAAAARHCPRRGSSARAR